MRTLALVLALAFLELTAAAQGVKLEGSRATIIGTDGPDIVLGWRHETQAGAVTFRVIVANTIYDLPADLRTLAVDLGAGNDVLQLDEAPVDRSFIWLGAGDDILSMHLCRLPALDAGAGNDALFLDAADGNSAVVMMGEGNDSLDVHGSQTFARWYVDLGAGADLCRLVDVWIGRSKITGGADTDRLVTAALEQHGESTIAGFEEFGP